MPGNTNIQQDSAPQEVEVSQEGTLPQETAVDNPSQENIPANETPQDNTAQWNSPSVGNPSYNSDFEFNQYGQSFGF